MIGAWGWGSYHGDNHLLMTCIIVFLGGVCVCVRVHVCVCVCVCVSR